MRRLLLTCILATGTMLAASPPPFAFVTAGAMHCGAIRRGEDIQVWCYTGAAYTADTHLENGLRPTRIGQVVQVSREVGPDIIVWTFTRGTDDVMNYSVNANGVEQKPGVLP